MLICLKPVPNCHRWECYQRTLCVSDSHELFFQKPNFFWGFQNKNNIRMVGNIFMQYFLKVWLCIEISYHQTVVSDVGRYLWHA